MNQDVYHIPALLLPSLEGLGVHPGGIYVDVTYGGGGHSHGILGRLGTDGRLYAFDQDAEALDRAIALYEGEKAASSDAAHGLLADGRLQLIHGNFRNIANFLRYYGVKPGSVDGILADLGVSFHHFDDPDRGFSFRFEGPLDMRMNQRAPLTAAALLAQASEERLADIFYLYGEMKNARKLAAAIVRERGKREIATVEALLEVIKPYINPKQEKKELAQVFQALRIEVNGELDAIRALMQQSLKMLKPGGRLAVITYHSLEDRLVKNFMKTGNFEGNAQKDFFGKVQAPLKHLTSKPIVPTEEEIEANPRSRSAKLRIAELIDNSSNL